MICTCYMYLVYIYNNNTQNQLGGGILIDIVIIVTVNKLSFKVIIKSVTSLKWTSTFLVGISEI